MTFERGRKFDALTFGTNFFQTHHIYTSDFELTYFAFGVIASFVLTLNFQFREICKGASRQFCNFVFVHYFASHARFYIVVFERYCFQAGVLP